MVGLAPRALEEIVRPCRLSGLVVRPLNFTVRRTCMTALFFAAVATLFGISVLSLAVIQTRLIARSGWKALQFDSYREMRELYWKNLTTKERWLVYPGLVAFAGYAVAAMVALLWQHFGS